jgi:hypothetical protein
MLPHDPLISHAIQLAVAPVFLLTGIAALLGVMANRLSRIIDRARALTSGWADISATERELARAEMATLEKRRRVCSWSLNFCTTAALLICVVIMTLFLEEFVHADLRLAAAALFIAAMVAVIVGLICFLREVYLATHTTAIDLSRFK